MAKVKYKHDKGVLHIGGGRFFHAKKPVEVNEKEVKTLLSKYDDLVLVEDGSKPNENTHSGNEQQTDVTEKYTKSSIKKLSADEQRELIVELGGNPEKTNNEDERIELILQLQEENQEEGE